MDYQVKSKTTSTQTRKKWIIASGEAHAGEAYDMSQKPSTSERQWIPQGSVAVRLRATEEIDVIPVNGLAHTFLPLPDEVIFYLSVYICNTNVQ